MTRTIFAARTVIDANADAVRRIALAVHPGPVGETNAMLFSDHGPATLEGGPGTFAYRSAGSRGTLEVTDATICYTGGWWFRGTYSIAEAGAGRTRVTFLVEDIARSPRWTVRLANRGWRGVRAGLAVKFRTDLARLARAVDAPPPTVDPGG